MDVLNPAITREPTSRYRDPLDRIWLTCAQRIGFRIERSAATYASSDGCRTITIGLPETLDPDDCLAQMILHEFCHALVEGPAALNERDWGLDNISDRDVPREQACLRLQAALLSPHGLRQVLAPTTDFRAFYDALAADPLAPREEETSLLARKGAARAVESPWSPHLQEALEASAVIARAAVEFASDEDEGLRSIWEAASAPSPRHPLGFFSALHGTAAAEATCSSCAWRFVAGPGRRVARCRQAGGARLDDHWPACERYEEALQCRACAACCREGYDLVMVSPRDPVVERRPEFVINRGTYLEIRREGSRCAALSESGKGAESFACTIYEDRPRCCQELEAGGINCLIARRRTGHSL